jgi:Flp pilus assembly protein TadD
MLNKTQIRSQLQAAWNMFQQGLRDDAAVFAREVLQAAPKEAEAVHLLGVLALQDGDIEQALVYLQQAIVLAKRMPNPVCYNNYGLALHEQGALDLAAEQYRMAIKLAPQYADAYYNLHALLLTQAPPQALQCLKSAVRINARDEDARFMLGVLLHRLGEVDAAQAYLNPTSALMQARFDAWQYLAASDAKLALTGSNYETFKLGFEHALPDGLVLEFGVRHGNSIRQIAALAQQAVHGFDSFEGLPDKWHHEPKGSYTTKGVIPTVPAEVSLHAGWFEDTLPAFLQQHAGHARFINVDCDIYSSTKTVLTQLAPRIVAGTVIVFDEYIGNVHWREDEYKAFQEAIAQYGWQYQYLSFSLFTKQVVVRIT